MKHKWILKGIKFLTILILGIFAFGFIVMMLWNALIPDIFHGPTVTYWQAIGLLFLAHVLFKGWHPCRHHGKCHNDRWKHRFEEKLASLTPEEREKFRQEWRERCGWSEHKEE